MSSAASIRTVSADFINTLSLGLLAEADARKAMLIVTYMLNTVYSLPSG
jgi:hypothetical protein